MFRKNLVGLSAVAASILGPIAFEFKRICFADDTQDPSSLKTVDVEVVERTSVEVKVSPQSTQKEAETIMRFGYPGK